MRGMRCAPLREIQRRWHLARKTLAESLGLAAGDLGMGIGIHCGELSFGEFGRSHRDLTAIGTVVNTASRVQGVAEAGEILVTEAVRERVGEALPDDVGRSYELKGFDSPIMLYRA